MSHQQSKADRSDAHRRRGARPGSGAQNHQRASAVKGGGGEGHVPSASAPLTSPNFASQQAAPQASTVPSAQRSNAVNGQPGGFSRAGFELSESHRLQRNALPHQPEHQQAHLQSGARHSKQSSAVKASNIGIASVPKPTKPGSSSTSSGLGSTEAAPMVAKAATPGESAWKHPELSFQFGSIGPGFMHGTGIQIPARTSSAPPNLDEQKQEQARLNAAMAKVVIGPSGGQQQGIVSQVQPGATTGGVSQAHLSHGQGQHPPPMHFNQPNVQFKSQAAGTTHAHLPAQVVASQPQQPGGVQLSYTQPALQPQQGLMQHSSGQSMKYPQTMAPLTGQMMAPPLVASLPGQLPAQQIPQLSHQLPPQASGALANQMQPGLPASQYGVPLFVPPRTSRAVKIVHPETHEELKFDFKSTKTDTSSAQGRVMVNGPPPHVRPPLVGYSSGAHHQMNMATYSTQQNGPHAHSYQQFYQAPLPMNPVVSSAVTGTSLRGHNANEASHGQRGSVPSTISSSTPPSMKPVSSDAGLNKLEVGATNLSASSAVSNAEARSSIGKKSAKLEEDSTDVIRDFEAVSEQTKELVHPIVNTVGKNVHTGKLDGGSASTSSDFELVSEQTKDAQLESLVPDVSKEANRGDPSSHGTSEVKQGNKKKKKKEGVSKADASKLGDTRKVQKASEDKKQMDVKSFEPLSVEASSLAEASSVGITSRLNEQIEGGTSIANNLQTQEEGEVNIVNIPEDQVEGVADIVYSLKDQEEGEANAVNMCKGKDQEEVEGCVVNMCEEDRVEAENPDIVASVKSSDDASSSHLLVEAMGVELDKVLDLDETDTCTAQDAKAARVDDDVSFLDVTVGGSSVEGLVNATHLDGSGLSGPLKTQELENEELEVDKMTTNFASFEHSPTPSSAGLPASDVLAEPLGSCESISTSTQSADVAGSANSDFQVSLNMEELTTDIVHIESGAGCLAVNPRSAPQSEGVSLLHRDVKESEEFIPMASAELSTRSSQENSSGDHHVAANPEAGHGSKKKRLKEVLAKADAAGSTADLYNAYKAPTEKKVDDSRLSKAPIMETSSIEVVKSMSVPDEKSAPKELDDWEDAAELPSPKALGEVAHINENGSTGQEEGGEKYTRDFLLTFRDQNMDLPADFEVRADIAELLVPAPQFAERDGRNSGRMLDRQLSGGSRRGNKIFEEERWARTPGMLYPPGRPDGMVDPVLAAGGFWPGTSQGLIARMPSNIRPGISVPPPFVSGKLLPSPMAPNYPGMARVNPVDSDKWERLPVGQKGLIPSPQTSMPQIHKAEKKYEISKVSDEEELKQRQMKGILNKLTPQNFEKLFEQVKDVKIQSAQTLNGVISQIFDKALLEPTFCEMYARFCVQLAVDMPEFKEDGEKVTFKRVLLNKCQEEFHRGEKEQAEANAEEEDGKKTSLEEREEKRLKAKRRMLGNIRFIGELYKKSMLTERIMHECIRKLLGEFENPEEEDVEALCKLMSTIGQMIDHPKARMHIDAYFERMSRASNNQKLSARLRFMLKDVIDLRRNGWQERRKVEGPKKIDEVRRDAVQERQATVAQAGRLSRGPSMGTSGGRRLVPPNEFGLRGPTSPMFPPNTSLGSSSQAGSARGAQISIRGPLAQDVRSEDRLLFDNRSLPTPLPQRPADEGSIMLGPQGGLGRGMAMRSQTHSSQLSVSGENRRFGSGSSATFGPGGLREEALPRSMSIERPRTPSDRPILERPSTGDRDTSARSGRGLDRTYSDKSITSHQPQSSRPSTAPAFVPLTEDQLKEKSESALMEYFSALDVNEVQLCVEELKAPKFYPTMVCNWVSLSLEKKDIERELLVKLLVSLHPALLKQDHIVRGFQMLLEVLEESLLDTPKAPTYIAEMLTKLVSAETFSLEHVANLLKTDSVREMGLGLDMITMVLNGLRHETGEQSLLETYGIHLEDFTLLDKGRTLHEGLQEKTFAGHQDSDAGKLFGETLGKQLMERLSLNEPVSETLNWLEHSTTSSMRSDKGFLQMLMTHILRHCIPSSPSNYEKDAVQLHIKGSLSQYAILLQSFAPDIEKQRQYIIAMQAFVHGIGHPTGLLTTFFTTFYDTEVISEAAYLKWQDDVSDSTPEKKMALKDVYKWLIWLKTDEPEQF